MEDLPPPLFRAVQCSVSWVRALVTTCCLVGHSWQGQGTCDCLLSGGAQLTGSGHLWLLVVWWGTADRVRALVTACCLVGHSWQGQGTCGYLSGGAQLTESGHLWLLVVWWGTADRVRALVTTCCLVGHSWQGQGGHLWLLVVWWGTADRVKEGICDYWLSGGAQLTGSRRAFVTTGCLVGHSWQGQRAVKLPCSVILWWKVGQWCGCKKEGEKKRKEWRL